MQEELPQKKLFLEQFEEDARYHVEAVHGWSAPEYALLLMKQFPLLFPYERFTREIAEASPNHTVFTKSRLLQDINTLPPRGTWNRTYKKHPSLENNLEGVLAQRTLWKQRFQDLGILEDDTLTQPYLIIFPHGKKEAGNDIVIGGKRKDVQLLSPRMEEVLKDRIHSGILELGILGADGIPASLAVHRRGRYCGSSALFRAKRGDDIHPSFGPLLELAHIELGPYIRRHYHQELGQLFADLGTWFHTYTHVDVDIATRPSS